MAHPLVLALFESRAAAMSAGKAVQALGVTSRAISVVARTHDEEGRLAEEMDATPGVELEDSVAAGRLGELSGVVLAAVALVMPGIGPIVAAGPLGAELSERIGHLAGGLPDILERAGVESAKARRWQTEVERGAVLLGVHVVEDAAERVAETLRLGAADDIEIARWNGELP
jgi:hypothetical protein